MLNNSGKAKNLTEAEGVVSEALPDTNFKIVLNDGNEIIAYLGGKMRMHRIKVLVGDKVTVVLDPYGGKGRIIRRS